MIFSIPSDFKEETINCLEKLNKEKEGKDYKYYDKKQNLYGNLIITPAIH